MQVVRFRFPIGIQFAALIFRQTVLRVDVSEEPSMRQTGSGTGCTLIPRHAPASPRDRTSLDRLSTMLEIVLSIPVADVSRTVDFYRHVLGFELLGATGKGGMTRARVRHGAVELLFRTARSEGMAEVVRKLDPDDRLVLYVKVEDIASLYKRVKGRAAIVRDLETTLFGMGEFAIEDLDGVVLWFSQVYQPSPVARPPGAGVPSIQNRNE